jgi:hypothetical protein
LPPQNPYADSILLAQFIDEAMVALNKEFIQGCTAHKWFQLFLNSYTNPD